MNPLSAIVVKKNFETLPTFELGNEPVVDSEGNIKIDDRVWGVSWRRSILGAFEPNNIEATFKRAVELIEAGFEQQVLRTIEAQPIVEDGKKLFDLFLKALGGVDTIAVTYRNEKKSKTADELTAISKKYLGEYQRLSKILNPEKPKVEKKAKRMHEKEMPTDSLIVPQTPAAEPEGPKAPKVIYSHAAEVPTLPIIIEDELIEVDPEPPIPHSQGLHRRVTAQRYSPKCVRMEEDAHEEKPKSRPMALDTSFFWCW